MKQMEEEGALTQYEIHTRYTWRWKPLIFSAATPQQAAEAYLSLIEQRRHKLLGLFDRSLPGTRLYEAGALAAVISNSAEKRMVAGILDNRFQEPVSPELQAAMRYCIGLCHYASRQEQEQHHFHDRTLEVHTIMSTLTDERFAFLCHDVQACLEQEKRTDLEVELCYSLWTKGLKDDRPLRKLVASLPRVREFYQHQPARREMIYKITTGLPPLGRLQLADEVAALQPLVHRFLPGVNCDCSASIIIIGRNLGSLESVSAEHRSGVTMSMPMHDPSAH